MFGTMAQEQLEDEESTKGRSQAKIGFVGTGEPHSSLWQFLCSWHVSRTAERVVVGESCRKKDHEGAEKAAQGQRGGLRAEEVREEGRRAQGRGSEKRSWRRTKAEGSWGEERPELREHRDLVLIAA